MYTLQSLHGHLSGFHFLIFWRKIGSVAQSLMSEGTKFQILGLRYDNVSVPYNTVFTLYERKRTSWHRLYVTLAPLNNSHIIFRAMRCLTLFISRATTTFTIFWDFLMFQQIFFSSKVKRCAIINYEHGIYELPHELPNELRLKILGN